METYSPQFERTDGIKPSPCPPRKFFEDHFYRAPETLLRTMGMRPWNKPEPDEFGGKTLWLLPYEWYRRLPNGLSFTTINEEQIQFRRGKTDDDRRLGLLSFGLLR